MNKNLEKIATELNLTTDEQYEFALYLLGPDVEVLEDNQGQYVIYTGVFDEET